MMFSIAGCGGSKQEQETAKNIAKVWLIGDSTVADYTKYDNYETDRYPVTGWGQVFQPYMSGQSLQKIQSLINADSIIVENHARGGRSTRTFFQEGRWRQVYEGLQKGDFVLMQFGHNDAAENKTERYVNEEGYKEFLRLFIHQTKQKQAVPILITPVARNYPWEDHELKNVHGNYPECVIEIAEETQTLFIDLNRRSIDYFTDKGRDYVSDHYFMNLSPGKYPAYPEGETDNTHFQPEGADVVSKLVYEGLLELATQKSIER